MSKSNKIIDAARAIRPELETIFGDRDTAQKIDRKLNDLLNVPDPTLNLKQIKQLLNSNQKTKEWVKQKLSSSTKSLGYQGLPGMPSTRLQTQKYRCSEKGCDFVWSRRNLAQAIPKCPHHNVTLIAVEDDSPSSEAES